MNLEVLKSCISFLRNKFETKLILDIITNINYFKLKSIKILKIKLIKIYWNVFFEIYLFEIYVYILFI